MTMKGIRWNAEINLGHVLIIATFIFGGLAHAIEFKYRMEAAEKLLQAHEARIYRVEEAQVQSARTEERANALIEVLMDKKPEFPVRLQAPSIPR